MTSFLQKQNSNNSNETTKNDSKTTENPAHNDFNNPMNKMISNPQINMNEDMTRSRHFSERRTEGFPNFSNFKEKQIVEELEEIDKLLLKDPAPKNAFLHDEDFALKNEEFNVEGGDIRFRGMKMKKIGNMNFLSELHISKQ